MIDLSQLNSIFHLPFNKNSGMIRYEENRKTMVDLSQWYSWHATSMKLWRWRQIEPFRKRAIFSSNVALVCRFPFPSQSMPEKRVTPPSAFYEPPLSISSFFFFLRYSHSFTFFGSSSYRDWCHSELASFDIERSIFKRFDVYCEKRRVKIDVKVFTKSLWQKLEKYSELC